MIGGTIANSKMDNSIEKGEKRVSEDVEVALKNVANAQKTLIDQQKELIDWLTDYHHQKSTSDKKSSATTLRFILITSAALFLLLLVTIALIVYKTSIFNTTDIFPPTKPNTSTYIGNYPVYSRDNWGALEPKSKPPFIPLPTPVVIISHSATKSCSNFTHCSNETQWIQYNFLQQGHRDIGYNFLIGGEGGIYEGRGWDIQNSLRAGSINIAFIGDFNDEFSTRESQEATLALINEGVQLGKVDGDYKLIGENQTSPKRFYSPGWNLVNVIKGWEHYFNGTML